MGERVMPGSEEVASRRNEDPRHHRPRPKRNSAPQNGLRVPVEDDASRPRRRHVGFGVLDLVTGEDLGNWAPARNDYVQRHRVRGRWASWGGSPQPPAW